jgi:hypothetical protein
MHSAIERTFRKLSPERANETLDEAGMLQAILASDMRKVEEETAIEALCEGYELSEGAGASEGELSRIKNLIEEHFNVSIDWDDVPAIHSFLKKGCLVPFINARLRAQKKPYAVPA